MKTLLTLQLTIFILVAVGFLMKKIHIIGPQGQKNINDLVIYLILPCNILHAFTQSATDGDFSNYLAILFISIGIQVFCYLWKSHVPKRIRRPSEVPAVRNYLLKRRISWKPDRGRRLRNRRTGSRQRVPDPAENHDVVFRSGCFFRKQ